MSYIGQEMAESKLRSKHMNNATKEQLMGCIMEYHIPEDEHFQGVHGDFLKDSFPRRCKVCGALLYPDEWEPVKPTESDCEHEAIGHYKISNDGRKCACKFPQECKKCGIDLKPKTWRKM